MRERNRAGIGGQVSAVGKEFATERAGGRSGRDHAVQGISIPHVTEIGGTDHSERWQRGL